MTSRPKPFTAKGNLLMKSVIPTILLLLLGITLAGGCSFTRYEAYDGSRQDKIDECNQLPRGQKEVCLEHVPGKHED